MVLLVCENSCKAFTPCAAGIPSPSFSLLSSPVAEDELPSHLLKPLSLPQEDKSIESALALRSDDTFPKKQNDRDKEFRYQYRQIGQALMTCEDQHLLIGIPWRRRIKVHYSKGKTWDDPTFDPFEFLKIELVGIKTSILSFYESDLQTLELDEDSFKKLHLVNYPLYIRHIPAFVIFCFCLLGFGVPLWISHFLNPLSIWSVMLSSSVIGISCAWLCQERQRRKSFAKALHKEIERRQGKCFPNKQSVNIFSAEEPV